MKIKQQSIIQNKETNQKYEAKRNQELQEAEYLFNQGKELAKNGKFKEAINIFNNSIQLFDQNDDVYLWKGFALNSLNKYQEVIECLDKLFLQILIMIVHGRIRIMHLQCHNLAFALHYLNKYQESIECYDKAISLDPNNDLMFQYKGLALHKVKKYLKAFECYNKALSISNNPVILKFKGIKSLLVQADSLFELGMKFEAKEYYLAALQQGSTEEEYIQIQLQKL